MARKRKNADAPVARTSRPRSTVTPRNRIVSVHTTASGRLGQSTSFLPNTDLPSLPASSSHLPEDVNVGSNVPTLDFSDSWTPEGDAQYEDSDSHSENEGTTKDDSPLQEWARLCRKNYLDEMIRHEGRAGDHLCHSDCGREGVYKCKDCFGFQLFCEGCLAEKHTHLPLHRILVRVYSV
jgi:hypothetical protein